MLTITPDQLTKIKETSVERFTASTVSWFRTDHSALADDYSDEDLAQHIRQVTAYCLDQGIQDHSVIRDICAANLRHSITIPPDDSLAAHLTRKGFSDTEKGADYLAALKGGRKRIKLTDILGTEGRA